MTAQRRSRRANAPDVAPTTEIEFVTEQLHEWIRRVHPNAEIVGEASTESSAISVYLLAFEPAPLPRGRADTPMQFAVRFLVSAWDASPHRAHAMLSELVFSALESPPTLRPSSESEPTPAELDLQIPRELWPELGLAPRPAFLLRALVRRERVAREVRIVEHPLVFHPTPIGELRGRVVAPLKKRAGAKGPSEIPLSRAQVSLPALRLSTVTDRRGEFRFAGVPHHPPVKRLVIRARNRELAVETDQGMSPGAPLVVRFEPTED